MTPPASDHIRSFAWYHGNLDWLPSRTIFLAKHGSHAYGTNTPESDLDLRGVAVAPKEYYLGFLKTFNETVSKTHRKKDGKKEEDTEETEVASSDLDFAIFDVRKFFKLAAKCNPNVLELMFVNEGDWYLPKTSNPWATKVNMTIKKNSWEWILEHRHLFLSTRARHTFSGYAHSQLKRIRSHRAYLLNPPKAPPVREDYGLKSGQPTIGKEQLGVINSRLRKLGDQLGGQGLLKPEVEEADPALVTQVITDLNLDHNLIQVVLAERRFGNAVKAWDQYQKHLQDRNPTRAALEAKHGYDTKHAMHLVRLLRMAREILERGEVLVKRPDAEELLAIRNGAWSFDQLWEWAVQEDAALEGAYQASSLPREADVEKIDQLLVYIVEEML
jgi:predicted nucleotidyltransferase